MANTVTISYTFGQILANVDASTITVSFLSGKDAPKIHSGLTLDDGTNPHGTTKTDVGLGNVDNTSDANKTISTATQTALDGKVTSVIAGTNITVTGTPTDPVINAAAGADGNGIYDGNGTIPSGTVATITDTLDLGNALHVDETNGRVGINNMLPTSELHLKATMLNINSTALKVDIDTAAYKSGKILEFTTTGGGGFKINGVSSTKFLPSATFTSEFAGLGGFFTASTPTDTLHSSKQGVFAVDSKRGTVPLTVANLFSVGTAGLVKFIVAANGNVAITSAVQPTAKLTVGGGIQFADDTDVASVDKVGTLRYRTDTNNSYVEMCVQNGAASYIWKIINQETW